MKRQLWSVLALTAFFTACVTVNIYFPAAAAEKAAEEIVKEVRGQIPSEAEEQKEESQPPEPEARSWQYVKTAQAQEGALEVSNASIRALKGSIKSRYPSIIPYFQQGAMGETKTGFLEAKSWEGLSLPDKAKVKRLIQAENRDRVALYEEVAKALQINPDQMERLRRIFAKEWQDTVPSGTWIQREDGNWVKK
jgi:uncharacterized protein YdbL (DUF1318 family)